MGYPSGLSSKKKQLTLMDIFSPDRFYGFGVNSCSLGRSGRLVTGGKRRSRVMLPHESAAHEQETV
jgi:hypothetical protein